MKGAADNLLPGFARRKVYTVAEVTRRIKDTLEDEVGQVWVEGEVSNLRRPASGHLYFTLKDETAQIRAVLFSGAARHLKLDLRDGVKLRVFGVVTVYERSGDYQVRVQEVEAAGQGALQAAFEALKQKLAAEGLFAAERKKPLPRLPQHVAVVTSPTGAALRDILNVLDRRFPNLHILIAPVKVQGAGAAAQIARALDYLNARGGLDVIIVGRGGGSLEDLWCFNEEAVARAIARSHVPVISAVGHEIDFTISDFAADLRAPTPSAAAEMVVGLKETFEQELRGAARRLDMARRNAVSTARHRLAAASGSYVFHEPANLVRQHAQRLDGLTLRLERAMRESAPQRRQGLRELERGLGHALQRTHQAAARRLDAGRLRLAHGAELRARAAAQELRRLDGQLQALNPFAVLRRGYSITRLRDGAVVRSRAQAPPGARIQTRVADGCFESEVTHGGPDE